MKTRTSSIILVVLFTLMTAVSQIFMKIGADRNIFNIYTFAGLAIYGIGTLLFIIALKNGELSALYPLNSLSFVWVTLIAFFYFSETPSIAKIFGTGFILTGTILIGARPRK